MTDSTATRVRDKFSATVRPTEKVLKLLCVASSVTATIEAAQFAAVCSPQNTKVFTELVFELKHVMFGVAQAIEDLKQDAREVKGVLRAADSMPSRQLLVKTTDFKEGEVNNFMRAAAKNNLAPFTGISRSIGTYLGRIEALPKDADALLIAKNLDESWKPINRKVLILTALYILGLSTQKTGD